MEAGSASRCDKLFWKLGEHKCRCICGAAWHSGKVGKIDRKCVTANFNTDGLLSFSLRLLQRTIFSILAEEGADRFQPSFMQEETDVLVREVKAHYGNFCITILMKSNVLATSLMLWCE